MNFSCKYMALLVVVLSLNILVSGAQEEHGPTVEQLIDKAHKHDNMWATNEDASQQKALECYDAALLAEPDEKQRLHILYRMAQLYGSAYQLEKGEKPDFHKAIELNKEIAVSYPKTEPLVFKAWISIGDHYVTLREFDKGRIYFQKALDYDIAELEPIRSEITEEEELRQFDRNLKTIKKLQKVAVDQVGYCGTFINPLCAHGVYRHISETHSQPFIREYAAAKLASSIEKYPDFWAPTMDMGDEPIAAVKHIKTANERATDKSVELPREVRTIVKKTVNPVELVEAEVVNEQTLHVLPSIEPGKQNKISPFKFKSIYYLISAVLIVPVVIFAGKLKKVCFIKRKELE